PIVGPDGTYLPFSGKASVDELTLGGFAISDASLEVVGDATGMRIAIAGETEVLGVRFLVDGELNSQWQGSLTLTLKPGESLSGAFGGLSGSGTFTLMLTGPASGSVTFNGSLLGVPGMAGALSVTG